MIPSALVLLVKHFEGLSKVRPDGLVYPYLDSAGYPTQGFGIRVKDLSEPPIEKAEAEYKLASVLPSYMHEAVLLCPSIANSESRLAAVTDFVFNMGRVRLSGSTFRRRVNDGDWQGAGVELRKWVWGRSARTGLMEKLPGLVKRRDAEAALLN
jgi:lysozyme